ncbi:flagellar hook-associated protein FlgK [Candidatus Aerophobetes bacterium]|uniref:Flagellar hook-associated protein 1 n=1 Tax=Aerophobetes bacterium TaxID=2030807 RepID=A0A662DF91_UNCAE|nr:MAG: flagellar hook-associated protein FlgK [Candidatus Aerophobetes bacterium]
MEALRSLEIGIRAVRTQRQALHVIGHNIANVNTPGFSRQRAVLTTTLPQGEMGTGVKVESVDRIRDEVVDFYIRSENPKLNKWKAKLKNLEEMEILFNEPSDNSIGKILNDFWDSWSDLANNPENGAARANVREQGEAICDAFRTLYQNLRDLQEKIDEEIKTDVDHLNSIINQIADLNKEIEKVELGGRAHANDLRDKRDLLLDELSELTGFEYEEMKDGTIRIGVHGQLLVSKGVVSPFIAEAGENGFLEVKWEDSGEKVAITTGKLKGLMEIRDEVIPRFLSGLDSLASTLIDEVNTLHRQGMGLDGTSKVEGWKNFSGSLDSDGSFEINGVNIQVAAGDDLDAIIAKINAKKDTTGVEASKDGDKLVLEPYSLNSQTINITADPDNIMLDKLGILANFFSGTGAEDIDLDDAIKSDLSKIAASSNGAPGDNSNALSIYQLKDKPVLEGGSSTFSDYYSKIIADLGVETKQTRGLKENQRTLLTQLENRRQSICGVSLDEETTNMILFQQAYRAAVYFLQMIDNLLDVLARAMVGY